MLTRSQIVTLFKIHNRQDNILSSLPKELLYKICPMDDCAILFETIAYEFITVCRQYSERRGALSDFKEEKCNAQKAIWLTSRIQEKVENKTKSLIFLLAVINEFHSQIKFYPNHEFQQLFYKFRERYCLGYTLQTNNIKTMSLQNYLHHSDFTAPLYERNFFRNPDNLKSIRRQYSNTLSPKDIFKKLEKTADEMLKGYEVGREIKFILLDGTLFSFSLNTLVETYIEECKLKQRHLHQQDMKNQEESSEDPRKSPLF